MRFKRTWVLVLPTLVGLCYMVMTYQSRFGASQEVYRAGLASDHENPPNRENQVNETVMARTPVHVIQHEVRTSNEKSAKNTVTATDKHQSKDKKASQISLQVTDKMHVQAHLAPSRELLYSSTEASKSPPKQTWGPYPQWWQEAWWRSTGVQLTHYVGNKPLLPSPCSSRVGTAEFDFVEPKDYISNSKNPCWYEVKSKTKSKLRCVPYFYLAGVAKCGTSDLYRRMIQHPDLLPGLKKEHHWWERGRFFEEAKHKLTFKEYIDELVGDDINYLKKDLDERGSSKKVFGDFSPSHLMHNNYWPDIAGNEGCKEPRLVIGQHMRHVYPKAKIILTFRHPTPRLYSRFLSRIHRTSWLTHTSSKEFHKWVIQGIKMYKECFATWSVRHCAYNGTLFGEVVVRLQEGMYPVMMADWLRVWPRNQMHIMRYEDYGGHEVQLIDEIFDFLGMPHLNGSSLEAAVSNKVVNSGSDDYQKYGPMLPETKRALDEFYQPFVDQFAQMLNDKRFLWPEYVTG